MPSEFGEVRVQPDGSYIRLGSGGWETIDDAEAERILAPPETRFVKGALGGDTDTTAGAVGRRAVLGVDVATRGFPAVRAASGVTRNLRAGRILAAREGQQAANQLVRRPSNILGRATAPGAAARLIEGGAEAVPGLNIPGLIQKATNQRRINASLGRALGLSDEGIHASRLNVLGGLDEALTGFNRGFRAIEGAIDNSGLDQIAMRHVLDTAVENRFVVGTLGDILERAAPMTGREVMALRSELTSVLASNEGFIVKNQARELINQIDNIIGSAPNMPAEALAAFAETRARWRVWASLKGSGKISADGQVNPTSARSALARSYGDDFLAGRRIEGVPDDVQSFLDIVNEGARLDVGLPSSGTAERAALGALIGGGILSQ